MKLKAESRTEKTTTIKLTKEDILELLKASAIIKTASTFINVRFDVPTGGDYSGMSVEIDKDNPVVVTYTETSFSEE